MKLCQHTIASQRILCFDAQETIFQDELVEDVWKYGREHTCRDNKRHRPALTSIATQNAYPDKPEKKEYAIVLSAMNSENDELSSSSLATK